MRPSRHSTSARIGRRAPTCSASCGLRRGDFRRLRNGATRRSVQPAPGARRSGVQHHRARSDAPRDADVHHQPSGARQAARSADGAPRCFARAPSADRIPAGTATLGARRGAIPYGWDNEFDEQTVQVGAFGIDRTTHQRRLPRFVEDVARCRVLVRARRHLDVAGLLRDLPLPSRGPCTVRKSSAAFARWSSARLLSEGEYHRAHMVRVRDERAHPWGDADPIRRDTGTSAGAASIPNRSVRHPRRERVGRPRSGRNGWSGPRRRSRRSTASGRWRVSTVLGGLLRRDAYVMKAPHP